MSGFYKKERLTAHGYMSTHTHTHTSIFYLIKSVEVAATSSKTKMWGKKERKDCKTEWWPMGGPGAGEG